MTTNNYKNKHTSEDAQKQTTMKDTDVFVLFEPSTSSFYCSAVSNVPIPTSTTLTTSSSTGISTNTFLGNSVNGCHISPTIIPPAFPSYNNFWQFNEELDLLWKSFFDTNSQYKPIKEKAVSHPCDIQETDSGLCIELAAVGLDKQEIEIITDSETLRVAYRKTEDEQKKEKNEYRYLYRSIKKASFDIAWKISSKYDLSKLEANLDKGLLTLSIPFARENKPKKVTIK